MAIRYVEHPPPPDLAAAIECMWSLEDRSVGAPGSVERVVPDGCIELIFHRGDPFHRWSGPDVSVRQPSAFVVGQLTGVLVLQPGGVVDTFGVRLRPGAAGRVLHVPLDGLLDRVVPLDELWGIDGARFADAMMSTRGVGDRITTATSFLRRRLARGSLPHPSLLLAVRHTLRRRGLVRVDQLARASGWSARQLERRYLHDVGLTPKRFVRTIRLNALLARLRADTVVPWADLALEFGFADQSHLIREFRALAGASPATPGALDGALMECFTSAQRLSGYFGSD